MQHQASRQPAARPREAPPPCAKPSPERRVLGLRRLCITLSTGRCTFVDEGAGRTLLLLHGAPMTSLAFVRLVTALSPHYRVVAPDLPGFGASEPLPAKAGTLADYASFVRELIEALGLHDFVGFVHDSSACIGLHALAEVPERVAGLVIADTVPLPLTGRAAPVRWLLANVISSTPVRWLNRRFNLLPWLVATLAPFLRPFSRGERRVLVEQFDTADKRDRVLDLFAQMGRDRSFMAQAATRTEGHLAGHPALLIYGQLDPMRFVGGFARFRQLLPRAQSHVVAGEEHFPMLASADRVAAAIHAWVQRELLPRRDGGER